MTTPWFDRVIFSVNEHPNYLPYWPHIAWAWKHLFGVKPTLGFVTDRQEGDPLVAELRQHGEVVLFPILHNISSSNLSKMARHYLATQYGNEICTINDIDLLPLQREYVLAAMESRIPKTLLCVGADVYIGSLEEGAFPMGYVTGESHVFASFLNPTNIGWSEWLEAFMGEFDDVRKDIMITFPPENRLAYSDELVYRDLIRIYQPPVTHRNRGFATYTDGAFCRANWQASLAKLKEGKYVEAHLCRPLHDHKDKLELLLTYLKDLPPWVPDSTV